MGEALVFGLLGSSALVIGGASALTGGLQTRSAACCSPSPAAR